MDSLMLMSILIALVSGNIFNIMAREVEEKDVQNLPEDVTKVIFSS